MGSNRGDDLGPPLRHNDRRPDFHGMRDRRCRWSHADMIYGSAGWELWRSLLCGVRDIRHGTAVGSHMDIWEMVA